MAATSTNARSHSRPGFCGMHWHIEPMIPSFPRKDARWTVSGRMVAHAETTRLCPDTPLLGHIGFAADAKRAYGADSRCLVEVRAQSDRGIFA